MLKRFLSLALAVLMAFSLCSCDFRSLFGILALIVSITLLILLVSCGNKPSGSVDAAEEDQNVYGVVVYTYSAYNADGYRVEVTFASGTAGITISK